MTKKQVLFWRFTLILVVISGGYFITQKISGNKNKSIDQVVEVKKTAKDIDINKNDEKTVEKEVELSIRPDDFYKKKKN
ncbi:hypothetical protein [Psychrilyobacter atlanticus]|uniref:hypothetical protein n=1 Tax=Psychrilyobacter atlanticus TaxID=271091 RepID=UPI0004090A8A|nr:hypothetical protein [Psychrilyobacter atlanticus]